MQQEVLALRSPPNMQRLRAGDVDQILDEVYRSEMPEPEWEELDSHRREEAGGAHGLEAASAAAEAQEPALGAAAEASGAWHPAAASASSQFDASRHPRSANQRRKQPEGVSHLFTWAGNGCSLAPLGALLPQLRTLQVALPPSLDGLFGSEEAESLAGLAEADITFAATGQPLARGSSAQQHTQADAQGAGSSQADSSLLPLCGTPRVSAFPSLRDLTVCSLSSAEHQWDPAARIGDKVLCAVSAGLPCLESLQVG